MQEIVAGIRERLADMLEHSIRGKSCTGISDGYICDRYRGEDYMQPSFQRECEAQGLLCERETLYEGFKVTLFRTDP